MADNQVLIDVVANDKATANMKKINDSLGTMNKQGVTLATTFKNVATGLGVVAGAAYGVKKAIDATVGATVAYADSVRTLTSNTRLSAEASSTLIQATEDYGLSVSDLTMAQKRLAEQGKSLSQDTLKQIATAYKSAGTAAEASRILTENFGRSGTKWADLMTKGVEGIDDAFAGVNKNLILDQKAIDQAWEYKMAVDNISDSWEGVKISIGRALIPALTRDLDRLNGVLSGSMTYTEAYAQNLGDIFAKMQLLIDPMNEFAQAQLGLDSQKWVDYGRAWERALTDNQQPTEDAVTSLEELYDITQKITDLDSAEAMREFANQMLYASLAADGLTEAELEMLKNAGAFTQSEYEKALAVDDAVKAYEDGKISAEEYKRVLDKIFSMPNDKTVTFTTILRTVRQVRGKGGGDWVDEFGTSPIATRASGGYLKGWTLVGDMPGGKPTAYSEIISPEGYVYNAQQTKQILAAGGGGYTSRAISGPMGAGTTAKPKTGISGMPIFSIGASGISALAASATGSGGGAAVVPGVANATMQASVNSVQATAVAADVMAQASAAQTAQSAEQTALLLDIREELRRQPLMMRDLIQQIAQ